MHCPTCSFRFTDLLSTLQKKLGRGDHFYIIIKSLTTFTFERTSDIVYFLRSRTTSSMHAAVLISTSVLTSLSYFTNYDSTYLQHFAFKMYEYHSGSELKPAIWRQMRMYAKKYFERKNTIGWREAGQLQMDQSLATYCWKLGFFLQCTFGIFMSVTFSTV